MIRLAASLGLLFSLLAIAGAQPTFPRARGFDKESIGIEQKLGDTLPLDTLWKDESDQGVRLGDYFNKNNPVVIVPIFFTCRAACLVVLDKTVKSVFALQQKNPTQEFTVVAFSINPKETAIDARVRQELVLKIYEESGHTEEEALQQVALAKKTWHFITGDIDSITKLTAAIGFRFTYEPEIDRINHAAGIMIASPQGKLTNYIYGQEIPAPALKIAIDQARSETIGAPEKPILLGCFMMDPTTGKYRVVVQELLKVCGIGTLLILSTSIFVLSKKNRQRSRLNPDGEADHHSL